MIKIRLTFLVAEKITADSQEGRVGCFEPRAEPLKAKAFRRGLAPFRPTPERWSRSFRHVGWQGNGKSDKLNTSNV